MADKINRNLEPETYEDYLFSTAEYEVNIMTEAQWVHARATKLEDAGRERLMDLLNQDDELAYVISHLTDLRLKGTELDGVTDMTEAQMEQFMATDAQVKAHLLALMITDLV